MLNSVFLSVIERSLAVCLLIVCVLVLRTVFQKAPRRILLLLWIPVMLRLLSPITVQSRFSIIPVSLTESFLAFFQSEEAPGDTTKKEKPDTTIPLPTGTKQPDGTPAGTDSSQITPGSNQQTTLPEQPTLPGQTGIDQTPANPGTNPGGADISQITPSIVQPPKNPENTLPSLPSGSEATEPEPSTENNTDTEISLTKRLAAAAPIFWLIGILILFGYILVESFRIRRLIKDTDVREIDGIPVYFGKQIPTPFLYGFLKPRIYMPEGLSEKHLSFVVAHEEMHKKGKDNLLKPFAFLIAAVYWFHPLVWVSYVLFCKDLELACDEQVLSTLDADGRKEYLQALLAIGTMPHSSVK